MTEPNDKLSDEAQHDGEIVIRYDQVEDAEALASVLHLLTNHLHENEQIELSDRNKLYDRIDDALGNDVPVDEVKHE